MKFLVIILLVFITLNAYPHPHVFIDVEADVEIKDGKISSITQRWVFDEMFSSMVLMDHDKNRNKRIDLNEINDLKKDYFDYLVHSSFFTFIKYGKKTIKFTKATDFMPNTSNRKLIYSFRLQPDVPVDAANADILIYDPTYYSSVKLVNVRSNADNNLLTIRYGNLTQERYYYGQISPEAISIRRKK